jgi:hypothetical protein
MAGQGLFKVGDSWQLVFLKQRHKQEAGLVIEGKISGRGLLPENFQQGEAAEAQRERKLCGRNKWEDSFWTVPDTCWESCNIEG